MMEAYMDLKGFTIRPYHSKRLSGYASQMSKDNTKVLMDENVYTALQLQSLPVEEAPRSVYRVAKLYAALQPYSPGNNFYLKFDDDIAAGVALAYTCFAKPKDEPYLQALPLTPETVELVTSNPSGSPGLTSYGCTKTQAKVRGLERSIQMVRGEKGPEACIAFKRTQFNDKTRLVWGFPYSMTIVEGCIAKPLLDRFKGGSTPMAFAMATGHLGAKLRVASYHKRWAYSCDMSAFDSSVCGKLIQIAFDIIQTWFNPSDVEPTTGATVEHIFKGIIKYFITTPIVMPNLKLYLGKNHGVPSGSFFTQLVDSIVNVVIAGAIDSHFHLNVNKEDIFVLGDDLLFWSDRKVNLDDIAQYVSRHLGVRMHGSEKSAITSYKEPVHFLGRDWVKGVPRLKRDEILKRMLYPERFRKYSMDVSTRNRQVNLLLLSYAAVYWDAWAIVQEALGSDLWYLQDPELIDARVYGCDDEAVNPDHLSGLTRYQMKYGSLGLRSRFTTTAVSIWL